MSGIAYFVRSWTRLQKYNEKPLNISTFDGYNSPYHPSVLYFAERWNGYRYWMSETPFSPLAKPYRDRNECPSIHCSDDGVNWCETAHNPIDNLTIEEISELDYFSDTHLVFADGVLECWYRLTHREGIKNRFHNLQLIRKKSRDGITWGDREVLVNLATEEGNALGNMVVSPAILYKEGKYCMWYVDSESRTKRGVSYSESPDGFKWEKKKDCTLCGGENMPWHIDVNYIDGKYFLVMYDFNNLTLWESSDGINFSYKKELLSPSVFGSFYGEGLYRACIIKDNKYRIYFSADDSFSTYIGLLEGEDINNLTIVSNGIYTSPLGLCTLLFKRKKRSVIFVIKQLIKRIKAKAA